MIKVWDFDLMQYPGEAIPDFEDYDAIQAAFDHNLQTMASLERRGFEGVFFSEHHFIATMSPGPNILLAALAKMTSKLKLGVMGNVVPFHQPWRLAEELAMLDYITHGRLEIGVAAGVPPEYAFVNIAPEDVRPMYKEGLDFLDMAAKQRDVTLKGKYYDYDEMPSLPRPRKEARRRRWMTIYSEASCRDAARRDYKICTGYQSVATAAVAFDGYRDEAAKLGRDVGPDDIGLRRQVLIWDTDAEANALNDSLQESAKARMASTFALVAERLAKSNHSQGEGVKQSGVIDADVVANSDAEKTPTQTLASIVSAEEYIIGSPRSVADQIIDQCRRLGAGNMMAYTAPTLDVDQLGHHYDLWEKVIPILAKAEVLSKEEA